MKIYFYEVKDYEQEFVRRYASEYGFELTGVDGDLLSLENVEKCYGCDAVSVLGFSRCDGEIIEKLAKNGVKYLATRTVGYEHIDLSAAKKSGIQVMHARYNSTNVSDFTIMLILMLLRKCKVSIVRALVNNFSLDEIMGQDLSTRTVGVVGTGKIGSTVIKNLSGFGCKILCNDKFENPSIKDMATYVSLDEIYKQCDIITLHMPLTEDNYHIIDDAAINKMKKGVILVNTARGQLIDTDALIRGIESEHIGAAGLDTIEGEGGICHVDIKTRISTKQNIFYLKQFPNVIYTPHIGFYTEEAVAQMVESTFAGITLAEDGKDNIFAI